MGITRDQDTVVLPSSKPTILLATMLLRPNEALSSEYLQRIVWNEDPPQTARATLQTYVLRLRRIFGKYGISDGAIKTVPGGYQLPVTEETLDLARFRALLRAADGARDPEAELRLIVAALGLWQGEPLSNIRSDVLHRDEVPVLREQWLRSVERRFDLELSLGRCRQTVAELSTTARAHPGHERFWEQLIEALYRSGRQSDALEAYRTVKRYVNDELGVDPRPSLQNLELAILRGEDLGPQDERPVRVQAVEPPIAQLPGGLPDFTGREEEAAELAARLTADRSGPAVAVISGPPGMGKTALAIQVAHLVSDRFPDGCAFVDLTEDGILAARARQAARFGVEDGRGRSLTVLDGVHDLAQILPFLPSGRGSAVLVTSRASMTGLVATRGASLHRLGTWEPARSATMLVSVIGAARADREPAAITELAELCGHLPFALRIAAIRLQLRPHQSVTSTAAWLRDDPMGRLAVPGDPAMSVSTLFEEFFARIGPRLTGAAQLLAERCEVRAPLKQCVDALGVPLGDAVALLDELIAVNVLEEDAPGVHRLSPLIRTFLRARPSGRDLRRNVA
ncbi:AfsR/SARP family transcriptional regulator [Streptomyces mirabilis]|uniref:AfsR/SARP family transcriptional regulator n=1 Tax=Streptomyces mirabilis TaxID=68239 RepID=UPI003420E897